jgi:arylformamidase
MTKQRLIDLSHPVSEATPPWPGNPPIEITTLDRADRSTADQRHSNASRVAMNIHCGTHMDAPFHFVSRGKTIDQVPLEWTFGLATLVRLSGKGSGTTITRADLLPFAESLMRTRKAILMTAWSDRWMKDDFFEQYPVIGADAARFLVECGVHLVGVETASVDNPPHETHMVLLGNDCLIVEGLRGLEQIETDEFVFAATPIGFRHLDGSPVRAVAIMDVAESRG